MKKEMLNFPGLELTFSALQFKNLAWHNHSSRADGIPKGFAGSADFITANEVSKTTFDTDEAACRYTIVTLSRLSLFVHKPWGREGKVPALPRSWCCPLSHVHVHEEHAGWSHFYHKCCNVDCCLIFSTWNVLPSSSPVALWSVRRVDEQQGAWRWDTCALPCVCWVVSSRRFVAGLCRSSLAASIAHSHLIASLVSLAL